MFSCYRMVTANTVRGRATTLNYHRVFDDSRTVRSEALPKEEFATKMRFLKEHFNVMPLPELLFAAEQNNIPEMAVSVTIDDGYEDGYSVITPILDDLNISAAFFITTEGIEQGHLWNDKITNAIYRTEKQSLSGFLNLPTQPLSNALDRKLGHKRIHGMCKFMSIEKRMETIELLIQALDVDVSSQDFLSAKQLVEMESAGMIIGAHTHSHPILSLESEAVARKEIERSKCELEDILQKPVEYFAYPNGKYLEDFNALHKSILIELGFKASLSTNWGCLEKDTDMMAIPRYTPWDRSVYLWGLRLCRHFRMKRNYLK